MKRLHLSLAATLIAAASAASAGDFYGGASIGSSRYKIDQSDLASSGIENSSLDKNDTGFKLYGGYQLNNFLAFEAGWADLGKAKASGTYSGVPVNAEVKGDGAFIDALFHAPVAQNVTLFGKIGAFHGRAKVTASASTVSQSENDSGTDVHYGLGATYAFNPKLAIRAEWERFRFNVFDSKNDTDLLSVGVNFKF